MSKWIRSYCNTKEKLLSDLQSFLEQYKPLIESEYRHSHIYYEEFNKYASEFLEQIEKSILIEPLPDGWEYSWFISYQTAELIVEHNVIMREDEPGGADVDQRFVLISVEAPVLTADEFAIRCNTNMSTVTQWIRRGKLKTAYKAGNTWKISALTEKPTSRGYVNACYKWNKRLIDLPEAFEYLNQYNSVEIKRKDGESNKFEVYFFDPNNSQGIYPEPIIYTGDEREDLETLLIANPNIEYIPNFMNSIMGEIYFSMRDKFKFF